MFADPGLGLARFYGILLLVLSLSTLVNRRGLEAMKAAKTDYGLIFVLGLVSLIAGALQVSFYNVWELNYRGLVTLFGWITLLRSALRLVWPDSNKKAFERRESARVVIASSATTALLGAYLFAASFGWVWGGLGV